MRPTEFQALLISLALLYSVFTKEKLKNHGSTGSFRLGKTSRTRFPVFVTLKHIFLNQPNYFL
jgi:hypothetical protein